MEEIIKVDMEEDMEDFDFEYFVQSNMNEIFKYIQ